jgi:hypothetical protein
MTQDSLQGALEAVLKFASLWESEDRCAARPRTRPTQSTIRDAETVFEAQEVLAGAAECLDTLLHFRISRADVATMQREQQTLRGWLDQLRAFPALPARRRTELMREIATWADEASVTVRSRVVSGNLRRVPHVELNGMRAVVGEVLSRLLDNDASQAVRIRRCEHCGRYFVGRADAEVCSTRCRVAKARRPGSSGVAEHHIHGLNG